MKFTDLGDKGPNIKLAFVKEAKLNEFAPGGGDDREPNEEEILRQLAAQWWNGTEQQMAKAQRTLETMGWEIGQDESGDDDAGVFLIRPGDVNGDTYIAFNHSDLDLNEGWKDKLAAAALAGTMALGAAGAQARVSPGDDPSINRLNGKPVATQVAPAASQAVQPGASLPGKNLQAVDNIEGNKANGYTITQDGNSYDVKVVPKGSPTPRGGKMMKVTQAQVGERGIGNYVVYLLNNGTAYLYMGESVNEASPRVDSLVTDALKIMQGSSVNDAVAALKTVLGNREYNSRRGHYNFYVKQLVDMSGQQGMAEARDGEDFEPALSGLKKEFDKFANSDRANRDVADSDIDDEDVANDMGQDSGDDLDEATLAQMRDYFNQPDDSMKVNRAPGAPGKPAAGIPHEIQALVNKMYHSGKVTPQEFEILRKFQQKTKINVGIKEADKNPYAIGMAQAMKSTGDKPPLKKSTINKAHEIARAVKKGE